MADWLYVSSVVVFVIALVILLFMDRKNVKRDSILILRKTQKGKNLLKRIGGRFPRGWKVLGMIRVFITFGASIFGVYFLLNVTYTAMTVEGAAGALSFVLPSPTPDVVVLPGVFAIPFWHLIISIAVMIVIHEGSHGIMAVREKVPIKSIGWGLLLVLPLAFVEPNEKIMTKKGNWQQLRIFAAGSFSNFMVAGVIMLISIPLLSGMFATSGVAFAGYDEGFPAEDINLTGLIVKINGQDVKTSEDLQSIMEGVKPDQTIRIVTKDFDKEGEIVFKTFDLTTAERLDEDGNPTGKAYIGIRGVIDGKDLVSLSPFTFFVNPRLGGFFLNEELQPFSGVIFFMLSLLVFIFILNFGVGLFNMLPIKPLDGGKMWEIVFKEFFPGRSAGITKTVSLITLFIVIAAFIVPNII